MHPVESDYEVNANKAQKRSRISLTQINPKTTSSVNFKRLNQTQPDEVSRKLILKFLALIIK